MPLLDAALAFAITMLAFATIVTTIVRFIDWLLPRLKGMLESYVDERVQLFKSMMQEFLRKELTNIIKREFQLTPQEAEVKSALALDTILLQMADARPLDHLSNLDLIDKLKQTDLGADLLQLQNRAAEVFAEISRRYAAIERKYSEIFRKKARIVATIVALVLAVVLNIDTIHIADVYLRNPTLAASIAAKSDVVVAEFEANRKQLQAQQLQQANQPGSAAGISQGQQDLKEAIGRVEKIQGDIKNLVASGFPVGWTRHNNDELKPSWPAWLIGILLTAGFAGLGSPFWFDVIRNLNVVTRGSPPPPAQIES